MLPMSFAFSVIIVSRKKFVRIYFVIFPATVDCLLQSLQLLIFFFCKFLSLIFLFTAIKNFTRVLVLYCIAIFRGSWRTDPIGKISLYKTFDTWNCCAQAYSRVQCTHTLVRLWSAVAVFLSDTLTLTRSTQTHESSDGKNHIWHKMCCSMSARVSVLPLCVTHSHSHTHTNGVNLR